MERAVKNTQAADSRLMLVVPAAMAASFLLLVFTFDDIRPAGLMFLLVPVSASGGILALVARGLPFSISAAIGFIATFGIAILNGVLLAAYVKSERARGRTPAEAAREAAERRLRPVMTTALVAALGFFPMAMSTGASAEVQCPLATVVIGGLAIATALTLLVLPALYPFADGLWRRAAGDARAAESGGQVRVAPDCPVASARRLATFRQ